MIVDLVVVVVDVVLLLVVVLRTKTKFCFGIHVALFLLHDYIILTTQPTNRYTSCCFTRIEFGCILFDGIC